MPEGDTLHKVSAALRPLLEGRAVRRVRSRDPAVRTTEGQRVRRVDVRGKHLLIEFDSEWVLRSHLGLHGSWHRYAPGEAWRKPERQASLVLETGEDVLVCFNAKEIELLRASGIRLDNRLRRLGPDLLGPGPDLGVAVSRARELCDGDAIVADVLLDQRVASGIGNVYKSETLFLERLRPEVPLDGLADAKLEALLRRARDLMRENLGGGPRTTRFANDGRGRLWVYGRSGKPCLRCDRPIESARLGRNLRTTYWCPACQR